ncbi:MAG: YegS/Rv2252/BmrU family lipid kinase [Eubacteriales bacterium]|nr:YegS/Rv2252/BmrU family lipid kinase [Eubacteriales bacterium]
MIVNPVSGRGQAGNRMLPTIRRFTEAGWRMTVYVTGNGDLTGELRRYLRKSYDLIICAGGDGTVSLTAGLLYEMNDRTPLMIFPTGTTNDYGRSLGLKTDMADNFRHLKGARPRAVDLGLFNKRTFTYVAAFGAFTDTSVNTAQSLKNVLGHGAYVISGLREFTAIPEYDVRIRVDGRHFSGRYALGMVSNAKYIGGFRIDGRIPDIRPDDGLLEVILYRKPKRVKDFADLAAMFVADKQPEGVSVLRGRDIRMKFREPVPWTLDGEGTAPVRYVRIGVAEHAVRIIY